MFTPLFLMLHVTMSCSAQDLVTVVLCIFGPAGLYGLFVHKKK